MLQSMVYVSRNLLIMPGDEKQLSAIRLLSRVKNTDLDLTGILIVTDDHFAQYIEGEPAPLAEVMASICRDKRHSDLIIWDPPQLGERRFPNWRMAFFGADHQVSRAAKPMLARRNGTFPEGPRAEMIQLIQDLSTENRTWL